MRPAQVAAVLAAVAVAVGLAGGEGGAARTPPVYRLVYASEWSGPTQLYSIDPTGSTPLAQLTFRREPPTCLEALMACGYTEPLASPDGRRIVYRTVGWPRGSQSALWLTGADGRRHQLLGYLGADCCRSLEQDVGWSADGSTLAYVTPGGLVVRSVDTRGGATLVAGSTSGRWLACPSPAPDGARVAFADLGRIRVASVGGSRVVDLAGDGRPGGGRGGWCPSWSPGGRWIAFRDETRVAIADVVTGAVRPVTTRALSTWPSLGGRDFVWSPDGRRLAVALRDRVVIVRVSDGRRITIAGAAAGKGIIGGAWSPDGSRLALGSGTGIWSVDVASGRVTRLSSTATGRLAWSPDGSLLAFSGAAGIATVTASGRVRAVVSEDGSYGGAIGGLAWVRAAGSDRPRPAVPVSGVYVGGRISAIAADGGRVAAVSCGRVVVWEPGGRLRRVDDRPSPGCSVNMRANIPQALAVAGDRVAYRVSDVTTNYDWELVQATLGDTVVRQTVEDGRGTLGDETGVAAGSGSFLAFSSTPRYCGPCPETESRRQELRRLRPDGGWDVIARTPTRSYGDAPLQPVDVEGDRLLVWSARDGALIVYGADGQPRASVPASAEGRFVGSLVVAPGGGRLVVYDPTTRGVVRTWPFAGGVEDAARGLVAGGSNGVLQVWRLSDGVRVLSRAGTAARFVDAGLAVADGARLLVVPWSELGSVE